MHTKLSLLLVLLILLSNYQQFNSPLSIEARNLASHGQTLTIDLIRRSSQPFHHSLSSNHDGHSTRTVGSEVIPRGGEYLMKIAIGTPPVELTAVADTGSDLVWVQCSPCKHCIPHEPRFNPKRSSSYKAVPCNSPSCNYTDFGGSCIPNSRYKYGLCGYLVVYADGTSSSGAVATDRVAFTTGGHDHSASFPSVTFGCGLDQQGDYGDTGDGVIGLGIGNQSLVSQLGYNKFTYCLTPPSSRVNAKLKLGPNNLGPGSVSTPLVNLDLGFYILQLERINIGKSWIKVDEGIIIDSGTTSTYLESNVHHRVKQAIKKAIKLELVPDPTLTFEPCYKTEETTMAGFNPPDVVFHFKGAKVVLKSINTFKTLLDYNVTCFAMLPTQGNIIFGNIAQVNFEIEYDLDAKKVSFAPTDCTKY